MKINTSDKVIAYLALLSGLTISAVAIWYSVAGLVSIFAAAAVPIIVMGVALEISKLIATIWLKINWSRAPVFIRAYLLSAIAILMLITSMGIFGFLSKAHSDQSLVSGDVMSKISIYDEKIKTSKENIDANRKALKQMDEAVDQSMARSTTETGADKAVAIRRGQAKERARLQAEIAAEQKNISQLNEQAAPIRAEVRKVEAEVGPLKYIAAFVYGDNPDANLLEKAVTWVIIIIVVVFDPLAVILLLASQYSFQWFRKEREQTELLAAGFVPVAEGTVENIKDLTKDVVVDLDQPLPVEEADIEEPRIDDTLPEAEIRHNEYMPSVPMGTHYASAVEVVELEDKDILDQATMTEAAAMTAWKHDHPDSSLKLQRKMLERGLINHLPWEDYLKTKADIHEITDREVAEEAAKWAAEKLEERPGDYLSVSDSKIAWMENQDGHQIKKTLDGYQQNAEQSERTIWQKIQDAKK